MRRFRPGSIRLDRRHWWLGISSTIKWLRRPVSEEGATQVARFQVGLHGPRFLADIERMRAHPVGRRLLEEKPDLPAAIEPENLATMPVGSFGHAYHQLAFQDDTLPAFMLGGLMYRDGFYDALDMDEDTAWYLERRMFDHDASHIMSGYGTDLAGEYLNVMFIQGHSQRTPRSRRFLTAPGLSSLFVKTTMGRRAWLRNLTEAYDRGAEAAGNFPHPCIPYEELLPMPLAEARAYLGIEELAKDWDTSDWCTADPYASVDPAKKQREAQASALIAGLVKRGLSWRKYMRADSDLRARVEALARRGGGVDEVAALLG